MLALVNPLQQQQPAPRAPTTSRQSSSSGRKPARPTPVTTIPVRRAPQRAPPVVQARTPPPPPPPKPVSVPLAAPAFDIHSYPAPELLRLLASLLTQIAHTNDNLPSAASACSTSADNIPTRTTPATILPSDPPIWRTMLTASRTSISTPSSPLTFHARNVPTISLEAYLLRILKYCPTTNEVFLALLVYFDRMANLSREATGRAFVIDSFNIHRLVIAGVTVASKFFSDVFYTNSRYAKVGGLPQPELNQLELQFLLLNDFRLGIPQDEMQRYAEQLILFSESSTPSTNLAAPLPTQTIVPSPTPVLLSSPAAMGAIDAYGGKVAQGEAWHRTPVVPMQRTRTVTEHEDPGSATETETTETETELSTEAEFSTDDEPTVRAGNASIYSVDSDTSSIYTRRQSHSSNADNNEDDDGTSSTYSYSVDTGDEGGDEYECESDMGAENDDDDDERQGGSTPEAIRVKDRDDVGMASP